MSTNGSSGPLQGLRVLEFAGLGPAPFCGMLLSDMGADVVRIDRRGTFYRPEDVEARGRRSLFLDLRKEEDLAVAVSLSARCNILIEGYRPGVMERLGLGPAELIKTNPALVYGRMTGWGQTGPFAGKAGHDINYLAVTGALHAMGPAQKPAVPLNLVADFGGGALYLAMAVLAAWHHARSTGQGQVVDCAMTDGVLSMMGMIYGDFAVGTWQDRRESNVIDGAAPFYNIYQCSDGLWLSVAAIEPRFYAELLAGLDISDGLLCDQWNREQWPAMKSQLQDIFATRPRDEWCSHFADRDACIAPVLSLQEARVHPQNAGRNAFITREGIPQPAPAPRFSETPSAVQYEQVSTQVDSAQVLTEWSKMSSV